MFSIIAGVLLIAAGLFRYRKTRVQIDTDTFEPAGLLIDIVSILLALFGLVLAGYLVWIKVAQG
jgi:uncharacterized membrane protein YidH (DUF202 family)